MTKKFWALFFMFWPIVAIYLCWIAPTKNWWFPGDPMSTVGVEIDGLFYLILVPVTVTFIGTQIGLGYVLWKAATKDESTPAMFSHGSHKLEVIWTVVPAFVLVFISLSQLELVDKFRVMASFPATEPLFAAEGHSDSDGHGGTDGHGHSDAPARKGKVDPFVEVTARQFEWRIRYAKPGESLNVIPQDGDLYYVNEFHVPTAEPVSISLRTQDVQHAFFAPQLRLKQDAVPGLAIPVWFEIPKAGTYDLLCAELCGWGHYKMKAHIVAESREAVREYLLKLQEEQNEDGYPDESAEEEE